MKVKVEGNGINHVVAYKMKNGNSLVTVDTQKKWWEDISLSVGQEDITVFSMEIRHKNQQILLQLLLKQKPKNYSFLISHMLKRLVRDMEYPSLSPVI